MVQRTGQGDPVRVLALLWDTSVKAGRKGLRLTDVLQAATSLADRVGIEQLSMRKLAGDLGVGTMTLYAHVPGKGELIDLMVDSAHGEVRYGGPPSQSSWRRGLREVAEANWGLLTQHAWLLDIDTTRPPLGPGTIAKYDAELRVLAESGLDDIQIDQVLSLVLEHVKASARQSLSREPEVAEGPSDQEWWDRTRPLLAAFMDAREFPYAARIGEAAGQEYGATSDPERSYAFGLTTILDGVAALIEREPASRRSAEA